MWLVGSNDRAFHEHRDIRIKTGVAVYYMWQNEAVYTHVVYLRFEPESRAGGSCHLERILRARSARPRGDAARRGFN